MAAVSARAAAVALSVGGLTGAVVLLLAQLLRSHVSAAAAGVVAFVVLAAVLAVGHIQ